MKLYDDDKGTVFVLTNQSINDLDECEQYAVGDFYNFDVITAMGIYYAVHDETTRENVANVIVWLLRSNAPRSGNRALFYAAQAAYFQGVQHA